MPLLQYPCPLMPRRMYPCARSRFPHAPLMAVGYSLGSVLLAKYLAEADNGLHDAPQLAAGSTRPQQQHTTAATGPVGSGIVAASLVSPPVCLYSTNSKPGLSLIHI